MRRRPPPSVEIPSPEADDLVAQAIDGDVDAFAVLFETTFPSVYRFLFGRCGDPTLAEDLAQDVYLRAMRAIRTSFRGHSTDFMAWLIRIARNRFFDHLKSGRVKWEVVVDELPVRLATGGPEMEALESVQGATLRKVLDMLTDEQQEIVFMRFFQGLHVAEVAAVTGRTQGSVKALQFRALRALAKLLSDDDAFDLPEQG